MVNALILQKGAFAPDIVVGVRDVYITALAPRSVLASGRIRSDAQERARRETQEGCVSDVQVSSST